MYGVGNKTSFLGDKELYSSIQGNVVFLVGINFHTSEGFMLMLDQSQE